MKTKISFITDLFESGAKPDAAGERQYGEDVAMWLTQKMRGGEFECGKPFQAAAGWELPVSSDGERFAVDITIMDESVGKKQADWVVTVRKERKWYGAKDSPLRHQLCDLLQNVLRDESQIREIGWED